MEQLDLVIDPRESDLSLLVQLDGPVRLTGVAGAPSLERMRGELALRSSHPLPSPGPAASPIPVELVRLGLYSLGSGDASPWGEISLAGTAGTGSVEATGPRAWTARIELTARVTYMQLAAARQPRLEPDSQTAPSVSFTGFVELALRLADDFDLDDEATLERGLRVELGQLALQAGDGVLRRFDFDLGDSPAFPLAGSADPILVLPLLPVFFPFGTDRRTGSNWTTQLQAARDVWGRCGIELDAPRTLNSMQPLGDTDDLAAITSSHPTTGAIEVYLVTGVQNGFAHWVPDGIAAIVLPDRSQVDLHLLAHEIGHVLGLCHPQGDDCTQPLQAGAGSSVLTPRRPIAAGNPPANCAIARGLGGQPLLRTK